MKVKISILLLTLVVFISFVLSSCSASVDESGDSSQSSTKVEDVADQMDTDKNNNPDEKETDKVLDDTTKEETTILVDPNAYLEFNREDFTLSSKGAYWDLYTGTVPVEYVTFSSDDDNIVTIDNKGRVTGINPGNTVVYAEFNGKKIGCDVRCKWIPGPNDTIDQTTPDTSTPNTSVSKPSGNSQASGFFSDAAFIGDSISMMLRNRCTKTGDLPGALFLVQGSYGAGHAVNGTMLLNYQGQKLSPEDVIVRSGVKKVFIMLGMNDLNIYGIDGTIENWRILTQRIKAKSPDVTIYVQSMSPVLTGAESGKLNNTTIDEYNVKLKAFADSNGFDYIDIATSLKDSTNGLAPEYCSDSFVHVSAAGADVWIRILEEFAENH